MTQDVRIDFDRVGRIGLPETILCQGKTAAQIGAALAQIESEAATSFLTRLDRDTFRALDAPLRAAIDYDPESRTGVFGNRKPPSGTARSAIVTAGASDLAVAREAARTLAFHGYPCRQIMDVGVAGLWRLLAHEDEPRRFPVVIVVAGLDGALFTVLGGLIGGVVIAVPTSTGCGAARGGRSALESALVSCAPGVVAVNIDNGYGAACAAARVLRAIDGVVAGVSARESERQ